MILQQYLFFAPVLETLIVSFVRSLTEFLAVSGTGHAILLRDIYGLALPPGVEGVVRWGMVTSIVVVFHRDLWAMIRSVWSAVRHPSGHAAAFKSDEHLRMVVYLFVGSVPMAAIGIPFGDALLGVGDDTKMVATFVIVSGLLLFLTRLPRRKVHRSLSVWISFLVGCAQALAIVPGLARMAAAISMGVYAGVSPAAAARYAALLALPALVGMITIGSGGVSSWWPVQASAEILSVAFCAAFAAGWLGLRLLLWCMATGAVRYLALYCLLIGLLGIILV